MVLISQSEYIEAKDDVSLSSIFKKLLDVEKAALKEERIRKE
jgi:hypothetical protein